MAGVSVVASEGHPVLEEAFSLMVPGPHLGKRGLQELVVVGLGTCSTAPVSRWETSNARHAHASAAYGAFVVFGVASTDTGAFGISNLEAQAIDP